MNNNVLICGSIKPEYGGGVSYIEKATIDGLKKYNWNVKEYFPFLRSMAITDFVYGLKPLKFDGLIHSNTNMTWNTKGAIRTFHGSTKTGKKIAEIENASYGNQTHHNAYLKVNSFLEQKCANNNYAIAISNYVKQSLINDYNMKSENIQIVYNGIDTDKFKPNHINNNKFIITWVGHFEFNKGIKHLCNIIEEMKEEKDIEFRVRLSTRKNDVPQKYMKCLNYDNVKLYFHGLDMVDFYNNSNCHLMTSPYEPLGLVVEEAMACEIPVISTKCCGPEEIITNEKDGYLFGKEDIINIIDKIKFLKNYPKAAEKIGKKARETILNGFTLDDMTRNTISAYKYFKERSDKK